MITEDVKGTLPIPDIGLRLDSRIHTFRGNFMSLDPEIFSTLCVTPLTEAERNAALAKLPTPEDVLAKLCATEDGIAALATLLGYGKVVPTTESHH